MMAPKVMLGLIFIAIVATVSSGTCSEKEKPDLDGVEKYCYEQFTTFGCENGTQTNYRTRRTC